MPLRIYYHCGAPDASEAYYRARYGYVEYGEDEARLCIRTAREVKELVERVEKLLGLTMEQ